MNATMEPQVQSPQPGNPGLRRLAFRGLGTHCEVQYQSRQPDSAGPFEQAVRERTEQHPDWGEYIHAYWRRWDEMLGGLIPGMEGLVGELRAAGAALYAITNWSAETFPLARERFPLLGVFDGAVVVSGEVGLVKPEPRIYELALERFGLRPEQCLFIDDNEPNVAGARRVGIAATRFVDAATLRAHPAVAAHLVTP